MQIRELIPSGEYDYFPEKLMHQMLTSMARKIDELEDRIEVQKKTINDQRKVLKTFWEKCELDPEHGFISVSTIFKYDPNYAAMREFYEHGKEGIWVSEF